MENDPFRHALIESTQPAPHEFVCSLRDKLGVIKKRYPHKESTVDSCLRGLGDSATLGHILVAAYVLNGGVSLKFSLSEEQAHDTQQDVQDFESLLKEMEVKITGMDLSHAPKNVEIELQEVKVLIDEEEDPLAEPSWLSPSPDSPEPEERQSRDVREESQHGGFTLQ